MAKVMQVVIETGQDVRDLPARSFHPTTPEVLDGLIQEASEQLKSGLHLCVVSTVVPVRGNAGRCIAEYPEATRVVNYCTLIFCFYSRGENVYCYLNLTGRSGKGLSLLLWS